MLFILRKTRAVAASTRLFPSIEWVTLDNVKQIRRSHFKKRDVQILTA